MTNLEEKPKKDGLQPQRLREGDPKHNILKKREKAEKYCTNEVTN